MVLNFLKRAHAKPLPLPAPFAEGDFIRLKGPQNPHKGNLRIGNAYQALKVTWWTSSDGKGYGYVRLQDDREKIGNWDIREFELYQTGHGVPTMKADEYDDAIAAQEVMDLISPKS